MEKSFGYKAAVLFASVLVCGLLSNGMLDGILPLTDVELSKSKKLVQLLTNEPTEIYARLAMASSQLLMFTGAALLYWWVLAPRPFGKYFQLYPPPNWTVAGLCLLLLIASYPLISASGILLDNVELPSWATKMDDDFSGMIEALFGSDSTVTIALSLLIVAVLPAIGEELLFRGIVQRELAHHIRSPHVAILLTSLLFSGIHLQVQGFLPKLLISYVLCYSYYWSRSLWVPMLLHLFNNGTLSLAMIMHRDRLTDLPKSETMSFPWLGVIISLFLCTTLIETIRKHIRQEESTP